MEDVHVIFTMLRCTLVWVTNFGQLVGCIARDDLIHANQMRHSIRGRAPTEAPPAPERQPVAAAAQTWAATTEATRDGQEGER